ncbi:lectin OAA [Pseudomonas sp. 148P]|uniref:Lectin OAA n=1 Tax=Pseudomonas ulcerans TaxID=3115852 RepID=A0ABU7HY76_9PSED|nr:MULTISPECIES: lectin OAA [unclassified Pseudomonas]MEE1925097.1 lectin OAA [Pseudomonas sp. 147P]MEE1936485.1 lectin OAA [Pseudomonas sp. 148P]
MAISNKYAVQNQWGGNSAPWHPGGTWKLGARDNQHVVAIDIRSGDGGVTFKGNMTYSGEGPIGFKAKRVAQNRYEVQNQWGGNDAPWHPGGEWVIGGRDNQSVVALSVKSNDGGKSLDGTNTYDNEGPIGFRSHLE